MGAIAKRLLSRCAAAAQVGAIRFFHRFPSAVGYRGQTLDFQGSVGEWGNRYCVIVHGQTLAPGANLEGTLLGQPIEGEVARDRGYPKSDEAEKQNTGYGYTAGEPGRGESGGQRGFDGVGKIFPIDRERATGGHFVCIRSVEDKRSRPSHFLVV